MTGPQSYTTTWYDLYHHLIATGTPMTVSGRLPGFDVELDWVATPQGLNRYDETGASTATWYPEPGDVLTTPVPVPAAARPRSYAEGLTDGKRLAVAAVADRIGLRNPDDVHPDESLGFLTFGELRRLIEAAS